MTAQSPTALKVLRGTVRADRGNPAEPMPATLELGVKPPAWVTNPKARGAWRDLSKLLTDAKILTVLDPLALGLLVDAFGDYLTATADIEKEGPYYWSTTEGGGSMRRRNPAVDDRKDAWVRLERILGKFGMNPSDRARVKVATETHVDPFETWAGGTG